jgi:hypothetical protein
MKQQKRNTLLNQRIPISLEDGMDKKAYSVYLEEEVYRLALDYARSKEMSFSALARKLLKSELSRRCIKVPKRPQNRF